MPISSSFSSITYFISGYSHAQLGLYLLVDKYNALHSCSNWRYSFIDGMRNTCFLQIILVGNKADLSRSRKIDEESGMAFANDNDMQYIEASALDNTNVEEAFTALMKQIHARTLLPKAGENETRLFNGKTLQSTNGDSNSSTGCCSWSIFLRHCRVDLCSGSQYLIYASMPPLAVSTTVNTNISFNVLKTLGSHSTRKFIADFKELLSVDVIHFGADILYCICVM